MKHWNYKQLILLAGGFGMLAFILPGLAATDKKAKIDPVKKGELRKAKSNPKVIAYKLPPKNFKPFEAKDLVDKGGKPLAPNALITLRNGKQITARKCLDELNEFEKKAVASGYSLRDKEKKVKIQEVSMNRALLAKQAKVASSKVFRKGLPETQTLEASAKSLEKNFTAAMSKTKGKALPGVVKLLKPISIVKPYETTFGDSDLGATIKGQIAWKADSFGTSLTLEGRSSGMILGNSQDLLVTTASLTTPRTGGLVGKIKATVLGIDYSILDKSQTTPWSIDPPAWEKSLPAGLRVEWPFTIFFIPCSAEIGVTGSALVDYNAYLVPGSSSISMKAHLKAQVYAQFSIDIDVAEAGVEAKLTLLDSNLYVTASLEQLTDAKGTYVKDYYYSRNDLKVLQGKLSFYVEVGINLPFIGLIGKHYDTPFFEFDGIQSIDVPFDGGEKHYMDFPLKVAK